MLGNTLTAWLAARRDGQTLVLWHALTWQLSSATASLLLLPMLIWLCQHCQRWPLHADVWRRPIPL